MQDGRPPVSVGAGVHADVGSPLFSFVCLCVLCGEWFSDACKTPDCTQAQFLNTKAEFFDPKAMQLHTACSTDFFRPTSGT